MYFDPFDHKYLDIVTYMKKGKKKKELMMYIFKIIKWYVFNILIYVCLNHCGQISIFPTYDNVEVSNEKPRAMIVEEKTTRATIGVYEFSSRKSLVFEMRSRV
jgi:hypothetical protein